MRTPEGLLDRFHALTDHRQGHILRVTMVMETLARRHGLDLEAARWAGFGHDLAREMRREALLKEAERLQLDPDPVARQEPILLHGPVAACWLEQAGIGGPAVWEAIRYHTTAGPGLGPLAKALFIADGVEPGRTFPSRPELYALALEDLEAGYRAVLRSSHAYLARRGIPLHPAMQAALSEIGESAD